MQGAAAQTDGSWIPEGVYMKGWSKYGDGTEGISKTDAQGHVQAVLHMVLPSTAALMSGNPIANRFRNKQIFF